MVPVKSFKKMNNLGKNVWTYWYSIEANTERMYMTMAGIEQENISEILLSTF